MVEITEENVRDKGVPIIMNKYIDPPKP